MPASSDLTKVSNLNKESRSTAPNKTKQKITPIIQTRDMKIKAKLMAPKIKSKEIEKINEFDAKTTVKISAAESFLDDTTIGEEDLDHDGVEISINGSDDEFADNSNAQSEKECSEDGQLSTDESGGEEQHVERGRVASKVVKVNKTLDGENSRMEKFKHLSVDPDFKDFLNKILDERDSVSASKKHKRSKSAHKDKGNSLCEQEPVLSLQAESVSATPQQTNNHTDKLNEKLVSGENPPGFKSPSDTTIYSPGLRRASNEDISLIEKISNFVESIRIDERRSRSTGKDKDRQGRSKPSRDVRRVVQPTSSPRVTDEN